MRSDWLFSPTPHQYKYHWSHIDFSSLHQVSSVSPHHQTAEKSPLITVDTVYNQPCQHRLSQAATSSTNSVRHHQTVGRSPLITVDTVYNQPCQHRLSQATTSSTNGVRHHQTTGRSPLITVDTVYNKGYMLDSQQNCGCSYKYT